jgi:hypothetical protein
VDNNVALSFEWIPTHENAIADKASRSNPIITGPHSLALEPSDKMLHPDIFKAVAAWAGFQPTIDLFATPENRQTTRFFARQPHTVAGFLGADCMAQGPLLKQLQASGSPEWLWVHPPWSLISATWSFLRACKSVGIMIIPGHVQMSWFYRITHEATRLTRIAHTGQQRVYMAHGLSKHHRATTATTDIYALHFDFS